MTPVEASRNASDTGTSSRRTDEIEAKSEQKTAIRSSTHNGSWSKNIPETGNSEQECCAGDTGDVKVVVEECSRQNSTTTNTRKRKGRLDLDSRTETPKPSAAVETHESGGRTNTRRRKTLS